jgi:3-oxoacyl-[acyl-carrier-protein] synthase III
MKNAIISGTGSYLPAKVLSNYDLEKKIETTHEWIYERTGIESRHIASETETTSFMAAQAARLALEASQS